MTNVFARVFRGGLASGAAGARGAVSPDNKIDNSLETTAESTWKLHLDPDK
jgi:hypothetical protein